MVISRITFKQEAFCQEIVKGLSQIEAHRIAYSEGRYTDKQRYEEACKILKNPKITQRIEELRKPMQEKFNFTVEQCFKNFEELKQLALTPNADGKIDFNSAVKCEENKAKLCGLYAAEKLEATIKQAPKIVDNID